MDDDEMEALTVSGLGNLTAPQLALAEFLEVDPDILAGAGMGSPVDHTEKLSEKDIDRWIDALPRNEVKAVMKQLLEGRGHQAERMIRNRFAASRRVLQTNKNNPPRRTVGKLHENAKTARQIRMEKQKRDCKRLEIRLRKEREAYLKNLSEDFPGTWKSVTETVERGSGSAYDEACYILVDICEAYELFANKQQFQRELKKFMASHMRRKALIKRLVVAGIWGDK